MAVAVVNTLCSELFLNIGKSIFSQGMCMSIIGPTLLDLQTRTGTTTKTITYVITVRSTVGLLGALSMGYLLDKYNFWLLLFLAACVVAAGQTLAALSTSIVQTFVFFGVTGFGSLALDTGKGFTFRICLIHIDFKQTMFILL